MFASLPSSSALVGGGVGVVLHFQTGRIISGYPCVIVADDAEHADDVDDGAVRRVPYLTIGKEIGAGKLGGGGIAAAEVGFEVGRGESVDGFSVTVEGTDKGILHCADGRQNDARHGDVIVQSEMALRAAVVKIGAHIEIAEVLEPCEVIEVDGVFNDIGVARAAVPAGEVCAFGQAGKVIREVAHGGARCQPRQCDAHRNQQRGAHENQTYELLKRPFFHGRLLSFRVFGISR